MIKTYAPSNIALIKYMGKEETAGNIATNPSLSITTEHLKTHIEIEKSPNNQDEWQLLKGYTDLELSEKGKARYLDFLSKLKTIFSIREGILIRTANDFPADAGLASSASSFAALTKAVYLYAADTAKEKAHKALGIAENEDPALALARISRSGSGSSCRSLFSGACIWDEDEIYACEVLKTLHLAVVVAAGKKAVSSSEAHKRIRTSLLNQGRADRAKKRLEGLMQAFQENQWRQAYEICWQEFWDMHNLFETSDPHFSFMKPASLECLRFIESRWEQEGNGPLVTMDAGPNVHLFFREQDKDLYESYKKSLSQDYEVIAQI